MNLLQFTRTLSCVLAAAAASGADIPEGLADRVYYEYTSQPASLSVRVFTVSAIILNGDGTYSGLFRATTRQPVGLKSQRLPTVSLPDGTYSYKKTGPNAAELTLDYSVFGDTSANKEKRILVARSNSSGAIERTGPVTASFYLSSRTSRAPIANSSSLTAITPGGTASMGLIVSGGRCHIDPRYWTWAIGLWDHGSVAQSDASNLQSWRERC